VTNTLQPNSEPHGGLKRGWIAEGIDQFLDFNQTAIRTAD